MAIRYVEAPDYATTNNIRSLWDVRDYLDRDVLLLEADIAFDASVIAALLAEPGNSVAVAPYDLALSGTVVRTDRNGRVTSFTLGADQHSDFDTSGALKTVNIYVLRQALLRDEAIDTVIHLAAQAGVRYSLTDPHAYAASNLVGFLNILEACRHGGVGHLLYASSSSVYGGVTAMPFSVHQNVDHPLSLYAATKKANELMAHSYSHLYGLPTTGLRFFTVYGPWGRPDMALYLFTRAILAGEPIRVFNEGRMLRDFTYIDDIVAGIQALAERPAAPDPAWSGAAPDPGTSSAPYRIYNIGNNEPVALLEMITLLEDALGRKAEKILLPMQPGDVPATYADIDDLVRDAGFRPATPLKTGIGHFVDWYRTYHGA